MPRTLRSSTKTDTKNYRGSNENISTEETDEEIIKKTPVKRRGRPRKIEQTVPAEVSPPKIRKEVAKEPETPTTTLSKSVSRMLQVNDSSCETPKLAILKSSKNRYSSARKMLSVNEDFNLPGREEEIKKLKNVIDNLLETQSSGSLYISGPPGTGKTASLMQIMNTDEYKKKIDMIYINCTSVATVGSIYKRIVSKLDIDCESMSENGCLKAIETFLKSRHDMTMFVFDEIDFLLSKKQLVLYRIFEWPAIKNSRIIIVGIANTLNLADSALSQLQDNVELKPHVIHYKPYTREQIIHIFRTRLEEGGVSDIFPSTALQFLAAKVAAVTGDVRRALDIGRRVIEIAENDKCAKNIEEKIVSEIEPGTEKPVQIKEVLSVVNSVYGTTQTLENDVDESFPLQQKLLVCAVLLLKKNDKNRGISFGRLHDVYKKICTKKNLMALDQSEFSNLCSLVEVRGIIRVQKKKESRLSNIFLEWNEDEIHATLKDKQLIAEILCDKSVLNR